MIILIWFFFFAEKEEVKKPLIAGKQPKIAGKQPKIAGKEPRAPIEKKDKKSDDSESEDGSDEGPKPLKIKQHNMEDNNKKGNKKGGKKRKKLSDLYGSDDDGDGDSGSDFKLSGFGSKSRKLRKIQIMENQESCSTLVENQIKNGPDAGKDEQALVHTRSIGAKNEERVEENNLTYAEVWALRQKIFQENVKI